MKRRQRRPVLDISNEQSESPRGRWQNKYQQIAVDHPEQNGAQINPLASLLGQYNSDSETEDTKQETIKLNDKVNDFLKEIQMIAPDTAKSNDAAKTIEPMITTQRSGSQHGQQSDAISCLWQECFDETTGYPYYWHIETNQVTWEMPSEMKMHRDKHGQNNQTQTQINHPHAQVQQWANFLPNTYPELQTNIPEGMIPKEVVARNRNRQVGLTKGRQQDLETAAQTPKKKGPIDDDSDDEKIEMITSFGNDESESDVSDNDSPVEKSPISTLAVQKVQKPSANLSAEKNSGVDEDSLSIGPLLPPGIIPMIHGPENASADVRNVLENRKVIAKVQKDKSSKNQAICRAEDSVAEIKDATKTDDIAEEDILKRLKNQAKLLQSLGGEVPESVETLIKNDVNDEDEREAGESADDIISQIEKEMPADHSARIGGGKIRERQFAEVSESGKEFLEKNTRSSDGGNKSPEEEDREQRGAATMQGKEFKISLVAGYSDDSEAEEETSPKKINPQPLFPISEYVVKESSNLLKAVGDLGYAKELSGIEEGTRSFEIKQTDAVSAVSSSIYNEEEGDRLLDQDSRGTENASQSDVNGVDTMETDEIRAARSETEPTRQHLFFENLEMPAKGFQRKKRIAFDVVPNKMIRPQSETASVQSLKTEASSLTFFASSSRDDTERHGFGFHKEQQQQPEIENTDSSGDGDKPRTSERDTGQLKKAINFVKGETTDFKSDEGKSKKPEFEKPSPEADSTKQLKELTEIVMEKIKFLSEGSQNLSAIQIMVIQLQTLVSAWEAGDLRESYLYEWLKGTGHELGRLEQAAAPPGWDCHWDRSHKRYYYRNSVTGEAQWTYPEADVVGGTEEMDLCTTPPPPEDEDLQIIEEEARNGAAQKLKDEKSPLTIIGDNKIVQITKDEYKSLEAPPPPQISSPSPPPPPRIFAEDLKKGKKRRGSTSDRSLDHKKEKTDFAATALADAKESVDPPLPPSPPKNTSQPPLPPNPPHAAIIPNPPSSEPLPPGVDPKDMPYPLPAVTTIEPSLVYAGATQTNPIYAATIADRGGITLPLIDHRSAIIQGQLMHYPTYQHLHNQAMIAAAGSLASQEAMQFMITDYAQVYANTQVIAKPPVKSLQNDQSLGSALDSFYNDIASIEKTNAEQESAPQEFDAPINPREAATPPPQVTTLPAPAIATTALTEIETAQLNITGVDPATGKEKKRKKTKIGIGKKQKEMSTMVAKWQKAQQAFDDSE